MNNKFVYTIISCCLLAFSCNSFLEENPRTFFNENTIYSTEEGIETAINGLYYALGQFEFYGSAYQNGIMPASGVFWSSQVANIDATSLNANSSNKNLTQLWSGHYKAINAANVAIDNLEKENTFSNGQTALGHAYFVRATCYLNLLRFYGGVPLKTMPITIETIHEPRASRADVIDQIIFDFNQAKQLMPSPQNVIYARPSNYAASVQLAKLYMYEAGFSGVEANWQKANDELLPVIESQEFELVSTFAELFDENNENTKESIFELQYGNTGGARTSDIPRLYTPSQSIYAPATTNTFGRIRPNKEFFDRHVATYPDDPRVDATYLYDTYEKNNGNTQKIYPQNKTGNQAFPVIAKWFDSDYNGITTERNYILLRYADVLLMMAEIENELNGPDNAYQYVNQVMQRARDIDGDGVSDSISPEDYAGLSQDEFRNKIMIERLFELLSEGQEWFDTRRRGYEFLKNEIIIPHNSNPTFDSNKDFIYPDDTKNLLLPIPLTELSGNQMISAEDQNPGY